jgi:hypothetical protein
MSSGYDVIVIQRATRSLASDCSHGAAQASDVGN